MSRGSLLPNRIYRNELKIHLYNRLDDYWRYENDNYILETQYHSHVVTTYAFR